MSTNTKKVTKGLGIAIIVLTLLVLGVPLVLHVLHLGVAIIKLVIEAALTVALFALGIWLLRR